MSQPILYSFRRCPYAMRARLGIAQAQTKVEIREVLLRDKAPEFLEVSKDATVPVLVFNDGSTLQESLDILEWAWPDTVPSEQKELIVEADGDFKSNLDRYKYASRFEDGSGLDARKNACVFLHKLNDRLSVQDYLFGSERGFADLGIAPFVRQFAHVDLEWFKSQEWPALIRWYQDFVDWKGFKAIMQKYPKWHAGDAPIYFPDA